MARNIFDFVQVKRPPRNMFDLSHDVKMSLSMGKLYPTLAMECVPGDKFTISSDILLRFAPLVSPVMHRMDVTMHYFFVPNRILWPNWEDFITNTLTAGVLPAHPFVTVTNANWGPKHDYLGLPKPAAGKDYNVSAFPFAAVTKIYNEYYRSQDLIPEQNAELVNGDNTSNTDLFGIPDRCWEHDYFTSALPSPQKGASVQLPLGEVKLDAQLTPTPNLPFFMNGTGTNPIGFVEANETLANVPYINDSNSGNAMWFDPNGSLKVDPTTINDLRRAYALQRWLEKQARGGTRYTEQILMQFGVKSSDARLQRPEYITGTKSPVVISEVLSTADTGTTPVGEMAGHGLSVTSGKNGSYFCEEHGYIIGIMSVMPKTAYQQGVPKHFLKTGDPFQHYWPDFANIGEQEIRNIELYCDHTDPQGTFGYIPRYAEYKDLPNRVAGEFKTTLKNWHLGRIFMSDPNLNAQFVAADPRTDIFAVPSAPDTLYSHVLHNIKAIRAMPKFGTPI